MKEETLIKLFRASAPLSRLFPGGFESFLLARKREGKEEKFLYRGLFFLYSLHVALILRQSGLFSKGLFHYTSSGFRKRREKPLLLFLKKREIPLLSSLAKLLLSEACFYAEYGSSEGEEGTLPSLAFTPAEYLKKYPEVKESMINPLYHYIVTGYREKREPFSFLPVPLEKDAYLKKCNDMLRKLQIVNLSAESLKQGAFPSSSPAGKKELKIAVHLHLYYPEMLSFFLPLLKNIPFPFDLFFSLREKDDGLLYRKELEEKLPNMNHFFWKNVPNRGRDMAPLLCTFGKTLSSQYDLFCHLHTKKSPHEPGIRDWGHELASSLLGSEERIRGIITLLQEEAKIVYPGMRENWEPDPLTFWNVSALQAAPLLQKAGKKVEDYPIIDFPHGNMFWARSSYLTPLLALGLTTLDFPPEPIAEEGSLAHILEHTQLILTEEVPGSACCLYASLPSTPTKTFHKAPQL